jgi:beta-aspartyl-peptidase (threonine type)
MFIRSVAAYDVSCLMEYKNMNLEEAMQTVVQEKLMAIGGEGGMIGVDRSGNAAMIFNSKGMYRGCKSSDGSERIALYQ